MKSSFIFFKYMKYGRLFSIYSFKSIIIAYLKIFLVSSSATAIWLMLVVLHFISLITNLLNYLSNHQVEKLFHFILHFKRHVLECMCVCKKFKKLHLLSHYLYSHIMLFLGGFKAVKYEDKW